MLSSSATGPCCRATRTQEQSCQQDRNTCKHGFHDAPSFFNVSQLEIRTCRKARPNHREKGCKWGGVSVRIRRRNAGEKWRQRNGESRLNFTALIHNFNSPSTLHCNVCLIAGIATDGFVTGQRRQEPLHSDNYAAFVCPSDAWLGVLELVDEKRSGCSKGNNFCVRWRP